MRVWIWSKTRFRKIGLFITVILLGGLLLCYPAAAAAGVNRGLAVCSQLLIPSLFPFMVLTGFVIRSGMAYDIGECLSGVTGRLLGMSGCASVALAVSMVGGYPAGASAVTQLYTGGCIDKAQARRLLCCCVNAGPAFIIGGVGVGLFGSAKAGLLLLAAHWLSSLLVTLCQRRTTVPAVSRPVKSDLAVAVNDSVHAACRSLIAMSGFVLLACTAVSVTDAVATASFAHSAWRTALTCLLEVSTGCMEAASSGAFAPLIIGAALGFGGLSVSGQIAAVTADHGLMTAAFFKARLLHALSGGCTSYVLFRLFDPAIGSVEAMAALSAVTQSSDTVAAAGLLSMMLMCVLFLSSLPRKV